MASARARERRAREEAEQQCHDWRRDRDETTSHHQSRTVSRFRFTQLTSPAEGLFNFRSHTMTAAAKEEAPIVTIEPIYLRRRDAAAFLSLSESKLVSLASKGYAPKPRQLCDGRVAWLVRELISWGEARPVSQLLPPPDSGYGRAGKQA